MKRFYLILLVLAPVLSISTFADIEGALRERAQPLDGAESLKPLVGEMAEARLVLMGEASHGTHEYYHWRAEMSRQLIQKGEVGFIAFEGDFDAFEKLDRYVRLREGAGESAREVLLTFNRWPRWMWANEDMEAFVEWVRDYNAERPFEERVALVGKDVYGIWNSLDRLMKHIENEKPERHSYWETQLGPLLQNVDDPHSYIRSALTGRRDSARSGAEAIYQKFKEGWSESLQGKERMDRFALYQHAHVVKSGEAHYRASAAPGNAGWNRRAQHMHETVQALLAKHGEDRRGIVWAHNTHIGDARATEMARQEMVNIGQLSRETLGTDKVFAVGFSTYKGTVLAGRQWQGERELMQVPEAERTSMDAELQRLGLGDVWLIWGAREELPRELRARWYTHRAIGVVYNPETERQGNYVRTIFPDRYNALIFIEESRALTPLHSSE
ncbi:MAG: erythromycin esterase family protein [Opitutales bacterium]|nr:erythromycin esterase family protein [Opitutales bacterium]